MDAQSAEATAALAAELRTEADALAALLDPAQVKAVLDAAKKTG